MNLDNVIIWPYRPTVLYFRTIVLKFFKVKDVSNFNLNGNNKEHNIVRYGGGARLCICVCCLLNGKYTTK